MQTKLLLCTHGELEAACAICFVADLKTQLRECEQKLKTTEEKLKVAVLFHEIIAGKGEHDWFLGKLESSPNKEYIGWDEVMLSDEALKQIKEQKD